MPPIAIPIGIAMTALMQSAIIFGGIYFCLKHTISLRHRAIIAGVGTAIFLCAVIGFQIYEDGIAPVGDPRIICALMMYVIGLVLWTWRTRASDLRELAEAQG